MKIINMNAFCADQKKSIKVQSVKVLAGVILNLKSDILIFHNEQIHIFSLISLMILCNFSNI